ncbi:MAG: hypothetical protein RLZZ618_1393 [Pseudomonadota bacterium]|jgi:ankyrin repeat protein
MGEVVAAARGAAWAVSNPQVWRELFGKLFSLRTLLFSAAALISLIGIVVGSIFLSRSPIVLALLMALWIIWVAPVVSRAFSSVVSHHVIARFIDEHGDAPPGMQAMEIPDVGIYRRWFLWVLAGAALVLGLPLLVALLLPGALMWRWYLLAQFPAWTFSLLQNALLIIVAIGFSVRCAMCTHLDTDDLDTLLKPRLRWVPIALVIALCTLLLQALLAQLTGMSLLAGSGRSWLSGSSHSWLQIAFQLAIVAFFYSAISAAGIGAYAGVGCTRWFNAAGLDCPSPAPTRPAPKAAQRRSGSTTRRKDAPSGRSRVLAISAGVFVALLALVLMLSKQIAGAVLSATVPDFKQVTQLADWSHPDTQLQARTHMACTGHPFAVRLLHHVGIRGDHPRRSGLACAARNGDMAMAQLLIKLGDDVNRVGGVALQPTKSRPARKDAAVDQLSPLSHALMARRMDMAEWLIGQGAKPAIASPDGWTAGHVAALQNCIACADLLKRRGADLNVRTPMTPLALWIDSAVGVDPMPTGMLQQLADLGMSPTTLGADGRSALHAAASRGWADAVEWLLARGADPSLRDGQGMTPLMHAGIQLEISQRTLRNPLAAPDASQALRRAAVLRLLAVTPALTGQVQPIEPIAPLIGRPPERPETGWSLARLAARDPAFRMAAKELGKTIDYGDVPTDKAAWHLIPPEQVRQALQEMSDDEFRSTLWTSPDNPSQPDAIPMLIATQGWRAEMERAVRLGLLHSERVNAKSRCQMLSRAVQGASDVSPDKIESWNIALALVASGARPLTCGLFFQTEIERNLALRPAAQAAQWAVHTALAVQ